MSKIALLGAGGKMGLRLTANLIGSRFDVRHVEISERGQQALLEKGIETVGLDEALSGADALLLALPDNRIGTVLAQIERRIPACTMVIMLDVAVAHAGLLPNRPDLTYFITHPCHPPVLSYETDPLAHRDFFGGEHARQHIVCCLAQGPEEHYALGEEIART